MSETKRTSYGSIIDCGVNFAKVNIENHDGANTVSEISHSIFPAELQKKLRRGEKFQFQISLEEYYG
jgi:hypothetical protein